MKKDEKKLREKAEDLAGLYGAFTKQMQTIQKSNTAAVKAFLHTASLHRIAAVRHKLKQTQEKHKK